MFVAAGGLKLDLNRIQETRLRYETGSDSYACAIILVFRPPVSFYRLFLNYQ